MLARPSLRPAPATSIGLPSLSSKAIRPTQIARRSTLKRSIDDTDLMNVPSSPSKRSRVTFDSDVEIVSADEEEDLDPLLVKEQVRRALKRRQEGDNDEYNRIKALFVEPADKAKTTSTKVLSVHVQALLANVSGLKNTCSSLVNAVIHSDWIGRDDGYYKLFVRFLSTLVAAQQGFLSATMRMLVELLGVQKTRRLVDSKPVRQPKIHRRVFMALQHLNSCAPAATGILAKCLADKLAYDFQKSDERMTFIHSFMELIQFVPELRSDILNNVLRVLIKLDVSIQVHLDGQDDAEEDILQHLSESQTLIAPSSQTLQDTPSDDDDTVTTDESDLEEEEDIDEATARRRQTKENVRQVDLIMDILFSYYAKLTGPTSSPQDRDNTIALLTSQFHQQILPTYRSRHPQFLIFHFAQQSPITVDEFVTSCIKILLEPGQTPFARHAAAAYFSGFVGRGAHVAPTLVQDSIDLLCDHLNGLLHQYSMRKPSPDLRRFADFYAIFQAILYIFCFRWRDIGSCDDDSSSDSDSDFDEPSQPANSTSIPPNFTFPDKLTSTLRQAIYSPLNPLRVCTPSIVDQFAELSRALRFLYIFPKLEENRHVRLNMHWRSISDLDLNLAERDVSLVGDNGRLEEYFPYDPYVLPMSRHWVEGCYVEWQGLPGQENEVDVEASEDSGLEDEVDEEEEDGDEDEEM